MGGFDGDRQQHEGNFKLILFKLILLAIFETYLERKRRKRQFTGW
jgi:hypothetical protein